MSRKIIKGIVTGGILGVTIAMYAINNMPPRRRRKMMRNKKRILSSTASIIKGLGIF